MKTFVHMLGLRMVVRKRVANVQYHALPAIVQETSLNVFKDIAMGCVWILKAGIITMVLLVRITLTMDGAKMEPLNIAMNIMAVPIGLAWVLN